MIPRNKLDIRWSDFVAGAFSVFCSFNSTKARHQVIDAWMAPPKSERQSGQSQPGFERSKDTRELAVRHVVPALSVRSGFDAVLTAMSFPRGSDILFSNITIKDMPLIALEHGLNVVPVEINERSLSITIEGLDRTVTPKSCAIVVAHLLGSRMPMSPIIDWARDRGITVLEDCAQAFSGDSSPGHPQSDVHLYSFGPIKTATAQGGAILSFRDSRVASDFEAIQNRWAIQSRLDFTMRLIRFGIIKLLSNRILFTVFVAVCRSSGVSHDAILSRGVRGFGTTDLFTKIRRRPCVPLLQLMKRRLRQDHSGRIRARQQLANRMTTILDHPQRPGIQSENHTYWVYAIYHPQPDKLAKHLWKFGFDATCSASSMARLVKEHDSTENLQEPSEQENSINSDKQPPGHDESATCSTSVASPSGETRMTMFHPLDQWLYLPFDPSISDVDLLRLREAIKEFDTTYSRPLSPRDTDVT